MTCPSCGTAAPEGARFCPSCGHPLQTRNDERRVVTVLFADVVGFTSWSETRDPEHVKNLIDRCFSRLVTDIEAFGGQVDKIVGDAIVALFGAPVAHEDDAERAVRAALQMQTTLEGMADEVGVPVRLRIGVNTGEVLVGALRAGGDYTVMGDVVNVASRLQTRALPGEVVVGPATYAATRGVVCYESQGEVRVRGREEPLGAWRAIGTIAPPGHRPRREGLPMVGRAEELGVLCNGLSLALTRRRAHLALLLGEAGIGKTRLAEELSSVASERHGARVLEGRCLPYGEANVWWPVAEALRQACGITGDDDAAASDAKSCAEVGTALGLPDDAAEVARVADGLRYFMGNAAAMADVDPTRAREDAIRSLLTYLEGAVSRRPIVLVLSELHWADTLILGLIDHLLDRMRAQPFVLVATARPDLEERWSPAVGRFNQVVLHLDPLPLDASRELLTVLLGSEPPPELRDLLLERSGGNPFFLEELVALLGDDVRPSELPATLRGLVSARLDALSPRERAVLEDAAVIGREGWRATVVAMAQQRGDEDGDGLLDRLGAKDLLSFDTGPRPTFEFRSELIREVAYETLTKAERARRHAAVAARFELRLKQTEREDEYLDQLAHHYGMAAELAAEVGTVDGIPDDITKRALSAIERAAIRAKQRELPRTSLRLLDLAMRLLPRDDTTYRRLVLLERAKAKTSLRDLAGARVDLVEGLAIAEQVGDECDVAKALVIRGEIEQKESDLDASERTLTDAITRLAELDSPHLLGEALRQRGMTRLFLGRAAEADADVEEALAVARSVGARQEEAWALWSLAWNAFAQSRLVDAEARLEDAMALFSEIGDWGAVSWARGLLGWVRFFQGRRAEAEALALAVTTKARDEVDKWALGMMLTLLAGVRMWDGRTDEAIEPSREALALFQELDDTPRVVQAAAGLARTLAAAGRVAEAREEIDTYIGLAGGGDPETPVGMMLAGTILQLGDAELALETLTRDQPAANVGGDMGRSEGRTQVGLALLQLGDARHAVEELEAAVGDAPADGPRANALAVLALGRTCVGDPDGALAAAEEVPRIDAATYADRSMAALAAGLAHVQRRDVDAAVSSIEASLAVADATGDRLLQAILRLGAAESLGSLEHPLAAAWREEAESRLGAMGVEALGWRNAFRLAVATPSHIL